MRNGNYSNKPLVDYEPLSYLEDETFLSYVAEILALMGKHDYVTTGFIHRTIGYDRQRFTLDALAHISCQQHGVPVRYSLTKPRVVKSLSKREANQLAYAGGQKAIWPY
jgi:hypothetical protein